MPVAIEQCNREEWIAGVWTLMVGLTLLFSSIFGLLKGQKLYAFASDSTSPQASIST